MEITWLLDETKRKNKAKLNFQKVFPSPTISLSFSLSLSLSLVLSSDWSIFRRSCYAVVAIWTSPWWKFTQYFWPIKCLKKFLSAAYINFFRFIAYGNVFDNSKFRELKAFHLPCASCTVKISRSIKVTQFFPHPLKQRSICLGF